MRNQCCSYDVVRGVCAGVQADRAQLLFVLSHLPFGEQRFVAIMVVEKHDHDWDLDAHYDCLDVDAAASDVGNHTRWPEWWQNEHDENESEIEMSGNSLES